MGGGGGWWWLRPNIGSNPTVSHQLELELELSVGLGSGWVLTIKIIMMDQFLDPCLDMIAL